MDEIDPVLKAVPPRFSEAEAAELGGRYFGVHAEDAVNLGSERDQTFLLLDDQGAGARRGQGVQPGRGPGDAGHGGAGGLHAVRADPALRRGPATPRSARRPGRPWRRRGHRARGSRRRRDHWVRAYDLLPGRARSDPVSLADPALVAWGETTARLGLAMRGFIHPQRDPDACRGTCSTRRVCAGCMAP